MKGTVGFEAKGDGDGSWYYRYKVKQAGQWRTIRRRGFSRKKDAQAALTAALAALGRGDTRVLTQPSEQPFGEYLTGWLDGRADLKPSSVAGYRKAIDCWLVPHLGDLRLRDLTPNHFVAAYTALRTTGGRRGGPLSERSIEYAHSVARAALGNAVESGALVRNPAANIPRGTRPRPRRPEMRTWTAGQARAFLEATADSRLHPLWALALDSGMRRGELCGFRWDDIDLDAARISVRRARVLAGHSEVVETTPKNHKARVISLAPGTVTILRSWKARLAAERLAAGPAHTDSGYVFVNELGQALHPAAVSDRFERAATAAPVPVIRLHDCRHTSATIDLAAGTHPKIVQEKLGHAHISMTLDLYSHVVPGMQEDAAVVRGTLLYGVS